MNKKLKLIYFSPTGTTRKIVKEIGKGISEDIEEFDISKTINRENGHTFDENDLVIIGVPVYGGRIPEFLENYFLKLKGNNTMAIFVVVYGNRDYDDALLELKETLEKNSFIGIAAGAFIGEHSYIEKVARKRPDRDDLTIAHNFGLSIKNKLVEIENLKEKVELDVKGKHPYKERGVNIIASPETNDSCIECGACAEACPMGAISFQDYSKVDISLCIHCFACVKICPVGSKSFNNETVEGIILKLIANFSSIRKEPELYYFS